MKKTIGIVGVVAFCLAAFSSSAQTPTTPATQPTSTEPVVATTTTTTVQGWDYKNNPTVKAITSKYEGKYLTARPAATEADIFPAIGKYESSSNADAASVSISLDAENKGIIWVDGLPQGRVKAILRKSPAVYKIPAQKMEDGKEIAEGTLIFDKDANTLNIIIGKPYDAENPASVFSAPVEEEVAPTPSKSKSKKTKVAAKPKPWIYSGTKVVVVEAAAVVPATTPAQ